MKHIFLEKFLRSSTDLMTKTYRNRKTIYRKLEISLKLVIF